MVNRTCTPYNNKLLLEIHEGVNPITVSDDHFHYIHNKKCGPKGSYRLSPLKYDEDYFYVQRDGKMYKPHASEEGKILSPEQYCMEFFIDDEMENASALVCYDEEEATIISAIHTYGMIVSMPFLLATFLVYAILPDRNLHGKSLMCYVISLFGAYLLLVIMQLYPGYFEIIQCRVLAIICFFLFMVSFFWMNVMSIDIWWRCSGLRGFSGTRKETEQKGFLLYSGYAWGVPLLLVVIVTYLTLSPTIPMDVWYNPGIGDGQCWFRDEISKLVYFYGPIAVLTLINVILFCATAWNIRKVKQETAMHKYENDKQRFDLYLKLMLAMGINWSTEIISWIVNWQVAYVPRTIWYLTDFCNAVYGIFIFFIFVFKSSIWNLLKKRYYMLMGRPHLARSIVQPQRSQTSQANSFVNQEIPIWHFTNNVLTT